MLKFSSLLKIKLKQPEQTTEGNIVVYSYCFVYYYEVKRGGEEQSSITKHLALYKIQEYILPYLQGGDTPHFFPDNMARPRKFRIEKQFRVAFSGTLSQLANTVPASTRAK